MSPLYEKQPRMSIDDMDYIITQILLSGARKRSLILAIAYCRWEATMVLYTGKRGMLRNRPSGTFVLANPDGVTTHDPS